MMRQMLILMCLLTGIWASLPKTNENRLMTSLLENRTQIGKYGRPVHNVSDVVQLLFKLWLIQILQVEEKEQRIKLRLRERLLWRDQLFTWNPDDFHGITSVRVPLSDIWIPDIGLENRVKNVEAVHHWEALVSNNGDVAMPAEVIVEVACVMDATYFPHDEQTCELKYLSWVYDINKLDVQLMKGVKGIDLSSMLPNYEWKILENTADTFIKYYDCCPEPYPYLLFTLVIQRNPTFYNLVIVYPSVLLAALIPLMFLTPPSTHDRNSYAIGLFGAFFLMLMIVAENIPQALLSFPVLGVYILTNMILTVVAMLCGTFVAKLNDYPENKYMNKILQKMLYGWMGRLFCVTGCHSDRKNVYDETREDPSSCSPDVQQRKPEEKKKNIIHPWRKLSKLIDRLLFCVYVVLAFALYILYIQRL